MLQEGNTMKSGRLFSIPRRNLRNPLRLLALGLVLCLCLNQAFLPTKASAGSRLLWRRVSTNLYGLWENGFQVMHHTINESHADGEQNYADVYCALEIPPDSFPADEKLSLKFKLYGKVSRNDRNRGIYESCSIRYGAEPNLSWEASRNSGYAMSPEDYNALSWGNYTTGGFSDRETTVSCTVGSFGYEVGDRMSIYLRSSFAQSEWQYELWEEPPVLVSSIKLNKTQATLTRTSQEMYPTLQLKATVAPADADNPSVIWSSSDCETAAVDSFGTVIAWKAGQAVITCESTDGSSVKATCVVTVKDETVTGITLNKTRATLTRTSTAKKPTLQLKATVKPAAPLDPSVTWTSSNPKVAKVSANGKVTALNAGTAIITCEAVDGSGVRASCKITVKNKLVTRIILNKTKATLKKGKSFQLKVKTLKPATALNRKVKWTSSNKKVATVTAAGKIKGIGKGTCIIYCTAADGSGIRAVCRITVK